MVGGIGLVSCVVLEHSGMLIAQQLFQCLCLVQRCCCLFRRGDATSCLLMILRGWPSCLSCCALCNDALDGHRVWCGASGHLAVWCCIRQLWMLEHFWFLPRRRLALPWSLPISRCWALVPRRPPGLFNLRRHKAWHVCCSIRDATDCTNFRRHPCLSMSRHGP